MAANLPLYVVDDFLHITVYTCPKITWTPKAMNAWVRREEKIISVYKTFSDTANRNCEKKKKLQLRKQNNKFQKSFFKNILE